MTTIVPYFGTKSKRYFKATEPPFRRLKPGRLLNYDLDAFTGKARVEQEVRPVNVINIHIVGVCPVRGPRVHETKSESAKLETACAELTFIYLEIVTATEVSTGTI